MNTPCSKFIRSWDLAASGLLGHRPCDTGLRLIGLSYYLEAKYGIRGQAPSSDLRS
jgi:hypothetical protein